MKKMIFWLWIFFLATQLASEKGKNILRIGISTFPASLNPVYVTSEISQAVTNKVFDSLFYFDEQGEISNDLVEGYSHKKSESAVVLKLKEDRFFSDGKRFSAEDVLSTFRLLKDPQFRYPYRSMLSPIQAMEKLDDSRMVVRLNRNLATWKNLLCFKILNSREIRSPDRERFKFRLLSGTGPYQFNAVREPSRILLKRNEYDRTGGLYDGIEYVVVTSTRMVPLKLINREIDISELQPEDVAAYRTIPAWQKKFKILKYQKFGFTYLVFNLKNTAVNPDIRRMFYTLLIRGDFIGRFIQHRGEPVKTPFLLLNPEEIPAVYPESSPDEPVRLRILTNSESKLRRDFVLFLKKELKTRNIYLDPLFLEYQSFIGYLRKKQFDLAVSGFILDIDYDLKDVLYHDAYFNYAGFRDQRMDKLLDQGLRELNPLKRKRIYLQANRIWKDQLPLIPLFNLYYFVGISREIPVPGRVCTLMASSSDFLINIRDWKKN